MDKNRPRGLYPAWRMNDKSEVDGSIPFYNTTRVALFEPALTIDQAPRLTDTVVAPTAKPAQLLAWAGVAPTNPRLWIGVLLGVALAALGLRSGLMSLPAALLLGLGIPLLCVRALAVGKIDPPRLGAVMLLAMSAAVALAGVVVNLT